ncbi:MAG: hypothetical protein GC168_11790 [Candidatus Hydrogenedens sp.]|nr:hypothetical protein [Candidatus Hydrogenedens sp.]
MRKRAILLALLSASAAWGQDEAPEPVTEKPRVESIALTGEAREQHYRMLYTLATATALAAATGIAIRRNMLRGLE